MNKCLPPGGMLLPFFPSAFSWIGGLSRFPWWQGSPCSAGASPTTCAYSFPGIGGRLPSLWKGFGRSTLWSARRRRAGSFLHGRLFPARRGHGTRLQRHASGGGKGTSWFFQACRQWQTGYVLTSSIPAEHMQRFSWWSINDHWTDMMKCNGGATPATDFKVTSYNNSWVELGSWTILLLLLHTEQ